MGGVSIRLTFKEVSSTFCISFWLGSPYRFHTFNFQRSFKYRYITFQRSGYVFVSIRLTFKEVSRGHLQNMLHAADSVSIRLTFKEVSSFSLIFSLKGSPISFHTFNFQRSFKTSVFFVTF